MKKQYKTWNECLILRELKALKKLNNHENIIKLMEVLREKNCLYFVFEFADLNLYQLMKSRNGERFKNIEIKKYSMQILRGTSYMHKMGFFHRDLKPENLLIVNNVVKIADFGLAREIRSLPPYTDYVSTRWYRAPEILLRSTNYNSSVDIWAIGLIIVELFNLKPIFPGQTEIDQLFLICGFLGSPAMQVETNDDGGYYGGGYWQEGVNLAGKMGFIFGVGKREPISKLVQNASKDAVEIIARMLRFDPRQRPTAMESLNSNWLQKMPSEVIVIPDEIDIISSSTKSNFLDISNLNTTQTNVKNEEGENSDPIYYYSSSSDDDFNEIPMDLLNSDLSTINKAPVVNPIVIDNSNSEPQRQQFQEYLANEEKTAVPPILNNSIFQQPSLLNEIAQPKNEIERIENDKNSIWRKIMPKKSRVEPTTFLTPKSNGSHKFQNQNANRYSWFFSKPC